MHVSTEPKTRPPRGIEYVALALTVAAVTLAVFSPAVRGGFVSWDDPLTVTDNYAIRGFTAENLHWMATTSHAGHYQPLSWLSLALDYAVYGLSAPDFPEARGFHLTNVLLHAAGALALFAFAQALYARAGGRLATSGARAIAFAAALAALLHAVHPLRAESVCWVTERRDVLSAPFFLLALLAYLRATPTGPVRDVRAGWLALCAGSALAALALCAASLSLADPQQLALRGPGGAGLALALALCAVSCVAAARGVDPARARGRTLWLCASLALLLVSLGAKAWGIVLPALLVVLDFWPLARWRAGAGEARPSHRAILASLVEKLPFAVPALVFARLAAWAQMAQQGRLDVLAIHTPGARAVQALYGLAFYPWKTLLPTGLAPLYPVPDDVSLAEPRFALGALATLALTALALALRRRAPALTAMWFAYALTVAPVLGVLQSGPQLVADRYAYLAGIPFSLAAGALWLHASERPLWRAAATLAGVAALAVLGALAWRQCAIWRDSETLWLRAYEKAPDSPLAALNLGLVHAEQAVRTPDATRRIALRDEALRLVGEASARRPGSGLYRMNEAIVLADRAGDLKEPAHGEDLARADRLASEAIAQGEASGLVDPSWYFQHGRMLAAAGRQDDAVERFEHALALRPEWPVPRLFLARAELDAALREAVARPEQALARVERAQRELAEVARAAPPTRSIAAAQEFASTLRDSLLRRRDAADAPPAPAP